MLKVNVVSIVLKYGCCFFGDKEILYFGVEKWLVVLFMGIGEVM